MDGDPRTISTHLGQRFAAAWQADPQRPPDPQQLLAEHPQASAIEQADVLRVELENRARHDRPVRLDSYLAACSQLRDRTDLLADLLVLEWQLGGATTEPPTVAALARRFPDLGSVESLAQHLQQKLSAWEATASLPDQAGVLADGDSPTHSIRSSDASTQSLSDQAKGSAPRPGGSFGDYELIEELARGGMGVVYKARQRRLNRIVALKMILAGQLASDEEVRRFYVEAESAAKLDHPGIVPIYEVNVQDGQHYFSMGFVDGRSLSQELQAGPLRPDRAAELMVQTAEAVSYAHQQGIIHRDLKPGNILLDSESRPRVTDFGLAKTVESDSDLTATGQVLGTPHYMPPEQALGKAEDIGPASDIYSLGAVLYCLLTGRPPFQAANVVATLRQVVEGNPVPPRMLNPAVDRDLDTICLKCLEKRPNDRYASADAVADELRRYLRGEPIRSRRIGPLTRAWRWCRRKPVAAGFALAAMLAILAFGLAWSFRQTARQMGEIAELRAAFESQLDEPRLEESYLVETESVLDRLFPHVPEEAESRKQRLYDRFQRQIVDTVRRDKLLPADIESIQQALTLLEQRGADANSLDAIRGELQTRIGTWKSVADLDPPYQHLDDVFPVAAVQPLTDSLQRTGAVFGGGDEQPYLPLRLPALSATQVRTDWTASWQDSAAIGVVLNAGPGRSYRFLLRLAGQDDSPQNRAESTAQPNGAQTFREAYTQSGTAVAEILKNGLVQQQREISLTQLSDGSLSLRVLRRQGQLSFQVGDQPALSFQDVFPLTASGGEIGLIWPAAAELVSLSVAHEELPANPSQLQRADDLFDRQRYEEALPLFRKAARSANQDAFRREGIYKEAICLLRLNRTDEAAALLENVLAEGGTEWPALAGCQLWLLHIQAGRTEQAESVYQALASRFDFEQLARLVPRKIRDEIVQSYMAEFSSVSRLLAYNPQRLRNLERAAAIDRFLSVDGQGGKWPQMELARAYRFVGDLPRALEITERQSKRFPDTELVRHHCRLLRLTDAPHEALRIAQAAIEDRDWHKRGLTVDLLMERARIHIALQNWAEAESDIDFLLLHERQLEPRWLSYIDLIKGFLRAQAGAAEEAEFAWRQGYQRARSLITDRQGVAVSEYLNVLILGSLAGDLTDDDASFLLSSLVGGDNSSPMVRMGQSMIGPDKIAAAFRNMWSTPFGREYAQGFAWGRFTLGQRVRIPLQLAVFEFVCQRAFGGYLTPAEESILWTLCEDTFDEIALRGNIAGPQLVQLGMAWKGNTSLLGWAGVAPLLEPSVRARISYVLGHRYQRLGQREQAELFFQAARQEGNQIESLSQLAAEAITGLNSDQALLIVRNSHSLPVIVRVVADDGKQRQLVAAAAATTSLPLPAGRHALSTVQAADGEAERPESTSDAQGSLAKLSIEAVELAPFQRRVVEVLGPLMPADGTAALPGLIASPRRAAGEPRWQLVPKHGASGLAAIAWRNDPQHVAIGGRDGVARVYSLPAGELHQVMLGPPTAITAMEYRPDGRVLMAAADDRTLRWWDADSGRPLRIVPNAIAGAVAIRWSADGTVAAVTNRSGHVLLWTRTQPDPIVLQAHRQGVSDLAWHPTKQQLATLGDQDRRLRIWDVTAGGTVVEANAELGPWDESLRHVCWSPAGTRLAVGGPQQIQILAAPQWQPMATLATKDLRTLHWRDDDRTLVVVDGESVKAFQTEPFDEEARTLGHVPAANILRWRPGGSAIATEDWGGVTTVVQLPTTAEPAADADSLATTEIGADAPNPRSMDWNPTTGTLALGGDGGRAWLLNCQPPALQDISTGQAKLSRIRWNQPGDRLAAAGQDGMIYHWTRDGTVGGPAWKGHPAPVADLAWSPDGSRLLSGSIDQSLRLWSTAGDEIESVSVDGGRILSVAWRDGQIVVADTEGALHLFDERLRSTDLLASPQESTPPRQLCFSPDQNWLLAASPSWPFPLAPAGADIRPRWKPNAVVYAVDWHPDGTSFVSGGVRGTASVWNLRGERIRDLQRNLAAVWDVAWSDDSQRIATLDDRGVLRVWNKDDDEPDQIWAFLPDAQFLVTTPSGKVLLNSDRAGEHVVRVEAAADGSLALQPWPDGQANEP